VSLQAVLAEIDPGWFAVADDAGIDQAAVDQARLEPALLARARVSALGERLLARWLVAGPAAALLAPTPQREVGATALRWPRAKLQRLWRDLGVLGLAPAIRAEVGRNPVRRLKQALGNSYLLALDRSVWDGRVASETVQVMAAAMHAALAVQSEGHDALYALFDRQGRSELQAWGAEHDPALGEWTMLLHPRAPVLPNYLPAAQVQLLIEHHGGREDAKADTTHNTDDDDQQP